MNANWMTKLNQTIQKIIMDSPKPNLHSRDSYLKSKSIFYLGFYFDTLV